MFQTEGGTELILPGTDSLLYPTADQLIDDSGLFLFQMTTELGVGPFSNEPNEPGYGMFGGNWTLNDAGSLDVTPDPASMTPEPSSLMLFGTELVGLAGIARRRFIHT